MLLVDAGGAPGGVAPTAAGTLGGTGRVVDWQRLVAAGDTGIPLALAGGLTAENVGRAIHATGVRRVDTASGVESAPGHKDRHRMEAFVAAAAAAFAAG